ncbi:MAG: aminomethyltransferase beta-barrel domain-containing protein [candidate division WOR-3 bacterium]
MKKILVGVSGGIDSLASVLYFRNLNYKVFPYFLILTENNFTDKDKVEEIYRNIGFQLISEDKREFFRESIIDYFINTYKIGKTPNPCAFCNRLVKFPLFLSKAKDLGVEKFSTGHYIRVENGFLYKGRDKRKDQSYYVSTVKREHLKFFENSITSFLTKEDVKKFVSGYDVKFFEKESQDICFIKDDYVSFLKENGFLDESGEMVDEEGKVLKKHSGYFKFTIGQNVKIGGMDEKLFVKRIIPQKNRIVVCKREDLKVKEFFVFPVEKFSDEKNNLKVKIRYRNEEVDCSIEIQGNIVKVKTKDYIYGVTPGQIAVLYDEDKVVLSGVIEK